MRPWMTRRSLAIKSPASIAQRILDAKASDGSSRSKSRIAGARSSIARRKPSRSPAIDARSAAAFASSIVMLAKLSRVLSVQHEAETLQAGGERRLLRLQIGLHRIGSLQLRRQRRFHRADPVVQRRDLRLDALIRPVDAVLLRLDHSVDRIAERREIRRKSSEARSRRANELESI